MSDHAAFPALHPISQIAALDQQLHDAVDAFVNGSSKSARPSRTFARCYDISKVLAEHLIGEGLSAHVVSTTDGEEFFQPNPRPEQLGYIDRLNIGCDSHYWTLIDQPDRTWAVDLTASQYGYPGPLAASIELGKWAEWIRPGIDYPALTAEAVRANRIRAGIASEYLDPLKCDVWIDPDGEHWVLHQVERMKQHYMINDFEWIEHMWQPLGFSCSA